MKQKAIYRKSLVDLTHARLIPRRRIGTLIFLALLLFHHFPVYGQAVPDLLKIPGQPSFTPPQSPVVEIAVIPQYESASPGRRMALAVVLTVPPGWYLYANPKQGQFGQDTEILPPKDPAFHFGKVIYPPGEKHVDEELKISNHIYEGKVICYIPLEVTPAALPQGTKTQQLKLPLNLQGQLCSDKGTCLPWQDQTEVTIKVAPADSSTQPQVNHPEIFSDYNASLAWSITGTEPKFETGELAADDWLKPILLALAAGLIMNFMPCVLPLIPIIVMTLMKQCAPEEGKEPDRIRSIKVGLAFALGIMLVFASLAVVMSIFKLIWGQHFQSNTFKLILLLIVYVLGLSMFGLFEIILPAKFSNVSVSRKGYLGALGMGMLTTVLATPCGAPLLTPVLTWSLIKPLAVIVTVFLIIGAGMATPYVILTSFPKLLSRIPKGGMWMIRLKQALGFAMLAYSIYLILLFPTGWQKPLFYFCWLLAFCIWLGLYLVNRNTPPVKRYLVRGLALVLIIIGSVALASINKSTVNGDHAENWLQQLENYQQQHRTVLVKFTANWCKNCAVLDKTIYKTQAFRDKLKQTDAEFVVADWSYDDPNIKNVIRDLAGAGQALPFAAVFPGSDPEHPILLRDFYSLEDTLKALEEASKR